MNTATLDSRPSTLDSKRAVFLDRDGVLNRDSDDFIKTPEELELLPGAAEAVARLNAAGFLCVVITNQSGIARGLFAEDALASLHVKLRAELAAGGGRLDAIYYCPHGPDDGCDCRKPATGMLLRAAEDHGVDLAASWVIGDRPGDIACGAAVGARAILVLTGKMAAYDPDRFSAQPDYVCPNVLSAARLIIEISAAPFF